MQKEFKEKREIDVNVSRTVCDICGNTAKEGAAIIRVQARREEARDPSHGPYLTQHGYTSGLDICSVECLTENIKGISLVLNTKEIPSISNPGHIGLGPNISQLGNTYTINTGNAWTGPITSSAITPAQWVDVNASGSITVTNP
jgi:hypothetical protein